MDDTQERDSLDGTYALLMHNRDGAAAIDRTRDTRLRGVGAVPLEAYETLAMDDDQERRRRLLLLRK